MIFVTTKTNKTTCTVTKTKKERVWRVVLINCCCHTFEEVVLQVKFATGCSTGDAEDFAYKAQEQGSVVVYSGSRNDCKRAGQILSSTGLDIGIT